MSWLRLAANSNCLPHIHIIHIESVLAHWYAIHGHIVVASNSYTHTTWLKFWSSWSLVEAKRCHYIMVEADSHLKLLSISTWEIYNMIQHIDWHMAVASNSYTHTTWLICWCSGSLVESKWCHYIMVDADSQLKLLPASIWSIYKVFEHIDMLSMGIWQ